MERVSEVNIKYVMEELERLKVEIQRLKAMLVPVVKNELSTEEVEEIEMEARELHEDEWIDADNLDDLLEDDS